MKRKIKVTDKKAWDFMNSRFSIIPGFKANGGRCYVVVCEDGQSYGSGIDPNSALMCALKNAKILNL